MTDDNEIEPAAPGSPCNTSSLAAEVKDGMLLCNRFRVANPVGVAGTQAFAVQATDELTGETVVCKIPKRRESSLFDALLRQYHLLRRIRSPRLPSLMGYFSAPIGDDTRSVPVLVLELVPGELAEVWFSGRDIRQRLWMFLDVVDVVADLNEIGVSHGDVHLGNVIVGKDGHAVLIDPESERFGSTMARRIGAEGSLDDLKGLKGCLEALVEDAGPGTAKGILERLGRDDVRLPTAREVATELRALLASARLPGETAENVEEWASLFRTVGDQRVRIYRRNYQLRDLEFRRWSDSIFAIAAKFGLRSEAFPDTGAYGAGSALAIEEKGAVGPHGTLVGRTLICETPDGDRIYFSFDGKSQFRRPWPSRAGLLSEGRLTVTIQGVAQAVVNENLELWLRGETPCLVVREVGRESADVDDRVARAFRVVTGEAYPGVASASRIVPSANHDSVYLSQIIGRYRLFDALAIPRPSAPTLDLESGVTKQEDSMGFGLLRVALSLRPNHELGNGAFGTAFGRITTLSVVDRYGFVAAETSTLLSMLRDHLSILWRFDVRIEDEQGPKLLFDVDATFSQSSFRGTLRLDYSVDPVRLEVFKK